MIKYRVSYKLGVYSSIIRLIQRNFKTFIFEPKFSYSRENQENYSQFELPDFYEITLYMIF